MQRKKKEKERKRRHYQMNYLGTSGSLISHKGYLLSLHSRIFDTHDISIYLTINI